ncbi:MAG: hypothetical protein EHM46_06445, partial [Bacteroidetes bacterium]
LAVQVHNLSYGSSDLTAIPFLSVLMGSKPTTPPPGVLELSDSYFHTDFKLDAGGEPIFLRDPGGRLVDSVRFPRMDRNHSYGRDPGEQDKWVVFTMPTPGNANLGESYRGYLQDTIAFSRPGGWFPSPFQLTLTAPQSADTIFYTLDGSEPGRSSSIFVNPVEVQTGAVVRARVLRSGYIPGKIFTRTFFPGDPHRLPVVAISTDPRNLWDPGYGIYVKGPGAETDFPYFNANFWQDWERPVHIEFYDETGVQGFSLDAGIRIFGGWSRGHPQKSLSIFARNEYGPGTISCPLFPGRTYSGYESFVLRNSGNDWFGKDTESGTMFRDVLMTGLTREMDLEYQEGRPSVVYINGEYWGIHNIREKINEHYLSSVSGIPPDSLDILESNQQVIQGSAAEYASLVSFLSANDISLKGNYEYVKQKMDVRNFIRYQVAQVYFDNRDWPGNNIKYWRPAVPWGKWRWIVFDTDFGFGLWDLNNVYRNTIGFALETYGPDWPNPPWSTLLLRSLMENDEFRED